MARCRLDIAMPIPYISCCYKSRCILLVPSALGLFSKDSFASLILVVILLLVGWLPSCGCPKYGAPPLSIFGLPLLACYCHIVHTIFLSNGRREPLGAEGTGCKSHQDPMVPHLPRHSVTPSIHIFASTALRRTDRRIVLIPPGKTVSTMPRSTLACIPPPASTLSMFWYALFCLDYGSAQNRCAGKLRVYSPSVGSSLRQAKSKGRAGICRSQLLHHGLRS